ncbi:MAG: hypothetical protein EBR02_01385 [Alphaproteobacteria bacterium]|nr:hypothetical protein [Alphaproteobacteria bacterium]
MSEKFVPNSQSTATNGGGWVTGIIAGTDNLGQPGFDELKGQSTLTEAGQTVSTDRKRYPGRAAVELLDRDGKHVAYAGGYRANEARAWMGEFKDNWQLTVEKIRLKDGTLIELENPVKLPLSPYMQGQQKLMTPEAVNQLEKLILEKAKAKAKESDRAAASPPKVSAIEISNITNFTISGAANTLSIPAKPPGRDKASVV